MSHLFKFTLLATISLGTSLTAQAADVNCPADMPLSEVNFTENDVKFIVVDAIPIEKFESEKVWKQTIGDIQIDAVLYLHESKTKKRVLLAEREIYATGMDEYNYTTSYEARIRFDDPAIDQIEIEHTSLTGGSVYGATVGSIENAFNGMLRITCEPATVNPTLL